MLWQATVTPSGKLRGLLNKWRVEMWCTPSSGIAFTQGDLKGMLKDLSHSPTPGRLWLVCKPLGRLSLALPLQRAAKRPPPFRPPRNNFYKINKQINKLQLQKNAVCKLSRLSLERGFTYPVCWQKPTCWDKEDLHFTLKWAYCLQDLLSIQSLELVTILVVLDVYTADMTFPSFLSCTTA
jgi:hypothetical protein